MRRAIHNRQAGITLLETIIGVAIVAMVAFSMYRSFAVLLDILSTSKTRIAAANLANEQIEIMRNLSYQSIGTTGGVPSGVIAPVEIKSKDGFTFTMTTMIRNVDDSFDGTIGGNPNDLSPADYKLVEVTLNCMNCEEVQSFTFTARAAPKNLETASVNGALFIQVINASGEPVSGATAQITNNVVSPPVNITDVTGADGFLRIIDVPSAVQSYHIAVSRSGFSSDSTYATSSQNPNPIKTDLTVALQTVTQSTFAIDQVGSINVLSGAPTCSAVSNLDFTLASSKLIGANPDVLKFNQSYSTDAQGVKNIPNLEWDNYNLSVSSLTYDLAGTIPYLPLNLAPGAAQSFRVIMQPKNPQALFVTVKDSSTQLPVSGAAVTLSAGTYNNSLTTGRGFLSQTDWGGGGGQSVFIDPAKYLDQDGNVEAALTPGALKLKESATSTYVSFGLLTSSSFDTGSPSNFYGITWQPGSQPPEAGADSVKFQIATATTTDPLSWDFFGPDGTAATYYTSVSQNINAVHNGDRYIRYRVYLGTASTSYTPSVSDVALTFASDCVPPGQVLFSGLAPDTYNVIIQRSGYQTVNDIVTVNQPWQESVYTLSP